VIKVCTQKLKKNSAKNVKNMIQVNQQSFESRMDVAINASDEWKLLTPLSPFGPVVVGGAVVVVVVVVVVRSIGYVLLSLKL
jgi:hypothetical protein